MIKEIIKKINKKEWWVIIATCAFVILATTSVYVYGYISAPEGYSYTGLHALTPGDTNVYFSYMNQTREGHLAYIDMYTTENQGRVMINIPWIIAGLVGSTTGLSNLLSFHLLRVLFATLFIILLYIISAYFWDKEKKDRLVGFLFLLFSSGLGVAYVLFFGKSNDAKGWYNWPVDLYAAEGYSFESILQSPHFILSYMLIILALFWGFWGIKKTNKKYIILSGITSLLIIFSHPFHIPTIFGVLGLYALLRNAIKGTSLLKDIGKILIILFITLPGLLYYLVMMKYDPITQMRALQNICLTPEIHIFISSYGLLFVFAVLNFARIIKTKNWTEKNIFIVSWFVAQMILIYMPVNFQRRMLQGLSIPVTILAVDIILHYYKKLRAKSNNWIRVNIMENYFLLGFLFLILFTPSHWYNIIRDFNLYQSESQTQKLTDPENPINFFIDNEKKQALFWIKENTDQSSTIIANPYNGNLIPGMANRKTYVGHWVETLFVKNKLSNTRLFYSKETREAWKVNFLKKNEIDYILYSNRERYYRDGENVFESKYWEEVYRKGDSIVYKVK